ncbi:MAG: FKBP-type peptidyl-prolyl cis-trans isomerase [Bacteroidota bacterium]
MKRIIFILFIITFTACEWEASSNQANLGLAKKLSEEEVINNTMNDFIGDPKSQAEKDRNIILNHIIDHQLDMQSTEDGIYYQIIRVGTGNRPTLEDVIATNYRGTFLDGKVFDSKMDRAKPFTYPLRRMNDGWKKALPLMKAGSKGLFIIPSELCYGAEGFGDLIPPNAILKFEIELLGIKARE